MIALLAALSLVLVGCDPGKPAPPAAPGPSGLAPVSAPAVLEPARGVAAPVGDGVAGLLDHPALGPRVGAVVVDAVTGSVILERAADRPRTPASLLKLLTGAAALTTTDLAAGLRTAVVESPGGITLVGSGDTTLDRRDLRALAGETATALRAAGRTTVDLVVDDSLFAGPAVSPDWRPTYVPSVVDPVTAVPAETVRRLVRLLERREITVTGLREGKAPAGAVELAAVESEPMAVLVERMLRTSDNDLAESMLRHVALAAGRSGTFADGTAATESALAALGLPTDGLVLLDGSGLARGSRVSPRLLANLLARAADPRADPSLDHLLSGLPVGGFTGTLATRYRERGGGHVRAKTGTLTGVSNLAGVASDATTAVVFVLMADRVPADTLAARAAVDRFAARLAGTAGAR